MAGPWRIEWPMAPTAVTTINLWKYYVYCANVQFRYGEGKVQVQILVSNIAVRPSKAVTGDYVTIFLICLNAANKKGEFWEEIRALGDIFAKSVAYATQGVQMWPISQHWRSVNES